MGDEDQVVVAENDLDLGARAIQAEGAACLGGDGDGAVAWLYGDEPETSLHNPRIRESGEYVFLAYLLHDSEARNGHGPCEGCPPG